MSKLHVADSHTRSANRNSDKADALRIPSLPPARKKLSNPAPPRPATLPPAHDFSRIPVRADAAARLQAGPADVSGGARAPGLQLKRECACGGGCPECRQKQSGRGRLQLKREPSHGPAEAAVPPVVQEALQSPGQPIASGARGLLESRLGHDFSRVRVHTDARSAEASRALNARAFTVGRDIVFAEGRYAPESDAGRRLLAHELVHVIQQGDSQTPSLSSLTAGEPGDEFEQEAERVANAPGLLREGARRPPGGLIQRQAETEQAEGQEPVEDDDDVKKYKCLADLMDGADVNAIYDELASRYADAPSSDDTYQSLLRSLGAHLREKVFADCQCCGQIVSVTGRKPPPSLVFETLYPPDPDDPRIFSLGERPVHVSDGHYIIEMHVKMEWGNTGACGCV